MLPLLKEKNIPCWPGRQLCSHTQDKVWSQKSAVSYHARAKHGGEQVALEISFGVVTNSLLFFSRPRKVGGKHGDEKERDGKR
jgi:hypothetical protein